MRRKLAVTLALAVAAVSVAGALPTSASLPVPAGYQTWVVSTDRPASMQLTFDRSFTVRAPFGASPDLSVRTHGDAVLVLHGLDAHTKSQTLIALHVAASRVGRSVLMNAPPYPYPGGSSFHFAKTYGDSLSFPAGRYQADVWASDGTARFELHLHGLEGVRTSRPASALAATSQSAVKTLTGLDNSTPLVFATQGSRRLRSGGFVLQFVDVHTTAFLGGQYFFCHRNSSSPGPALDPSPGCPTADDVAANDRDVSAVPGEELYVQALSRLPVGDQHVGVWSSTEGLDVHLRYRAVWVPFDH